MPQTLIEKTITFPDGRIQRSVTRVSDVIGPSAPNYGGIFRAFLWIVGLAFFISFIGYFMTAAVVIVCIAIAFANWK